MTPNFLRTLHRFSMSPKALTCIDSILTGCITACCGDANAQEWKMIQNVMDTAQSITGKALPTTEYTYMECFYLKAALSKTSAKHRALYLPVPLGRRYRGPTPPGSGIVVALQLSGSCTGMDNLNCRYSENWIYDLQIHFQGLFTTHVLGIFLFAVCLLLHNGCYQFMYCSS